MSGITASTPRLFVRAAATHIAQTMTVIAMDVWTLRFSLIVVWWIADACVLR